MASDHAITAPSATIEAVGSDIDGVFTRLDELCACPLDKLRHRPAYANAWTVAEHLEHVSLVNHFLLLTIGKGVATALRRAKTQPVPTGESDLVRLAPIADPSAFSWEPPGHMIPGGLQPVAEVRALLDNQHERCRGLLEQLGGGEGRLCSFRMSVYNLGKLDMYQWLCFLACHGLWHLAFLARREAMGDMWEGNQGQTQ